MAPSQSIHFMASYPHEAHHPSGKGKLLPHGLLNAFFFHQLEIPSSKFKLYSIES